MDSNTLPIARQDKLLLALTATMGGVSLVYQVTWTRQLTNLLGSTVTAIALITALFMLGMAIGAWLEGRRTDTLAHPLRTLGVLALGLAASGGLGIPLYHWAASLYAQGAFGTSRGVLLAVSIALASAITLVPTALVGASFPIVSKAVSVRMRNIASGTGATYAASTAGSVAGSLLAGFVLVALLGVTMSIAVAAAASAVVGGLALYLDRGTAGATPAKAEPRPTEVRAADPVRRAALIAFTLSGAAVMMYEAVWTREVLLVFGSSVYAIATMLAAVLTGLAIGQWLGRGNSQEREAALGTIGLLQLAGAGAALISLLLTRAVPLAYALASSQLRGGLLTVTIVQFLLAFLVIVAPAALLGATAPIAVRLSATRLRVLGSDIGGAYALNTLGAVAGSLAAGLLLMPLVSTVGTAGVAAALNGLACVAALRVSGLPRRAVGAAVLASAGVACLVTLHSATPLLNMRAYAGQMSSAPAALLQEARDTKTLYSNDAPQGRVAVYQTPDGALVLKASGMTEGAGALVDVQTTQLVIRLPVAVIGEFERALVIGLGTGSTTSVALQADDKANVDTVEINPSVVEASTYFVGDSLSTNPRSRMIIDDARHYLATTETRYDLIASEPSYPLSSYSARMFTRESFEAARSVLAPGGVMLEWLPAYLMDESDLRLMMKTFGEVYPNMQVWATRHPEDPARYIDYLFVGINGDQAVDPVQVERALNESSRNMFAVAYLYGPQDVAAVVADDSVPVNTDDRPVYEFRTPLLQMRDTWK